MIRLFLILLTLTSTIGCRRIFDAPVPQQDWPLFHSAAAQPLSADSRSRIEGTYNIQMGSDVFGEGAAFKWSYTVSGADTTYHLSGFCQQDAAFIVCEGKRLEKNVLLNGYWRKPVSTETGRIQLTIAAENGAAYILANNQTTHPGIRIEGVFGFGEDVPQRVVNFTFIRRLPLNDSFEIIAHRGGGRTADLLPASENSLPMIRLASRYGATGIEIDIRMTKDGVPILFHDATLNERLIQKNGLVGPISYYTYDQLSTLVRLTRGERIPTLREALETVLRETPLRFVWLDTKYNGPLTPIVQLQQEFQARAAILGRKMKIFIGVPDEDVLKRFRDIPSYRSIPSLSELTPEQTREINARIWAPQWTAGLQQSETLMMQAEGRSVIPWTLDIPANIQDYLKNGNYNGMLSNFPSAVAYYHYAFN